MEKNKNRLKSIHCFLLLLILLTANSCSSSASGRVEYVAPPENLLNKKVKFKTPIVYLVFENSKDAENFGFKSIPFNDQIINNLVFPKFTAENSRTFKKYPRKNIKEGMVFEVLGSYWVRESALQRSFAGEFQYIILVDEKGIFSVCSLNNILMEADIL